MKWLKLLLFGIGAAAATPSQAQVDYLSLSAISDRFPPAGWQDVAIFQTTGWQTLNVTSAAQVGAANVITPGMSNLDTAQKIENIIAATSGNRILSFPAGDYYLLSHLDINTSNILILGAGVGVTRFNIRTVATDNGEIEFAGPGLGAEVDVVGLPARGDTSITVGSAAGLAVNDIVHVYEKSLGPALGYYSYGQMAVVTAVSGTTVSLSPRLGLSFLSDPKLAEVSVIRNVGIRGITVYRDRAASSAATNNIEFQFVKNGYAREVESSWLERGGVTAFFSMDVVVISSFIHDAYFYGDGGQAYGVSLTNNTTRSRVTDNKAWNLRHHFIMNLGTNHSIISYNSAEPAYSGTDGDILTHGFTVHNSLFEGNMGRDMEADGRSDLNAEQYSGIHNTFYRNNLTRYSGNGIAISAPDVAGNFPNVWPTVIGNATAGIFVSTTATNPFVGSNLVGSSVVLGNAQAGWSYPASLYLTAKPTYFGSRPWPIFGPAVTVGGTYGVSNNIPAYDRARPPIYP